MPLAAGAVGLPLGPRTVAVLPWQGAAYAAATGDLNPAYLDGTRPGGAVAPPLFGVGLDWPLQAALRGQPALGLTAAEAARGVHATHDLLFHRLIRPGDRLTTTGRITAIEPRPPGAYLLTRYDTVDAGGAAVLTVWYGSLFRGVEVAGAGHAIDAPPPLPVAEVGPPPRWTATVDISPGLPHLYTACAGIYNPIHTERQAALAAGLPDIILHGTATHALAARELVAREAGGDPARLARIACRFGAMVLPGTAITIRALGERPGAVFFDVRTADGGPAIRDGVALFRPQTR